MGSRAEALDKILALAEEHAIGLHEIAERLNPHAAPADSGASRVAIIFGYLAAIFVIAGVATFIGINWDKLNSFARVLVTLGLGLMLLFYALWNEHSGKFPVITGGLYVLSYLLQPTGILVALDEWASGDDAQLAIIVTGTVMTIQAAILQRWRPHPVLLLALIGFAAGTFATYCDRIDVRGGWIAMSVGSGLTLIGLGLRAPGSVDVGRLSILVGSAMAFAGAGDLFTGTPAEVLLPGLSALGLFAAVTLRSRLLLLTSVLSLLAYLSYFTARYFADSLGWPLVLVLLGILFAGVGMFAMRLSRRIAVD